MLFFEDNEADKKVTG